MLVLNGVTHNHCSVHRCWMVLRSLRLSYTKLGKTFPNGATLNTWGWGGTVLFKILLQQIEKIEIRHFDDWLITKTMLLDLWGLWEGSWSQSHLTLRQEGGYTLASLPVDHSHLVLWARQSCQLTCLWTVGGSWSTQRKPTQAQTEHTESYNWQSCLNSPCYSQTIWILKRIISYRCSVLFTDNSGALAMINNPTPKVH